jgi:hypothetical protein
MCIDSSTVKSYMYSGSIAGIIVYVQRLGGRAALQANALLAPGVHTLFTHAVQRWFLLPSDSLDTRVLLWIVLSRASVFGELVFLL